ncbi:four and a half LIM domains protein 2-like [Hydractinia symbiolongicarpus]|uniref:four and a half LIM domains protein 2-like n=1 Tax=Hydractinia symbiolongicarpus TaxID=13093 RepID=UPI00254CE0A2|nr:four and a half LIM domains protein 2-like [Hydractinia symbiolongicarpus]XP_057317448.1 four and a half LIM domains protein 2-like [Hydractinia symbiolongicarpus]
MPDHCTKCGNAIHDTTVTFEKKPYHPECFICHQCRKQLSGDEIYQHEGNNYDAECYSKFHARICGKCEQTLADPNITYVTYGGQTFHPDCFTCQSCNKTLAGKSIYKHEGHNYDQECYSTFHAKKCAVCYQALVDPKIKYVTYDGKTYHPDCFVCHKCKKTLSGKQFYLVDDTKVCEDCH